MAGDNAQPPIEYDKGYEFDHFFQGAGWFYGIVITVQEEEDVLQVRFDGGNEPSATIILRSFTGYMRSRSWVRLDFILLGNSVEILSLAEKN